MDMQEILGKMTLAEKLSLITGKDGLSSRDLPHLGIPSKTYVDGPHGVRENNGENCTHFPNMCAIAASWDPDMIYKMGQGIAADCIRLGIAMILGPGVNLKRSILCGRNFEYLSEDPVLAGRMAAAYVRGVQDMGIGACPKHYAANSQELDRLDLNAEIDERTLRELYLKVFEIIVKESKPESVMCAYNKINAIWCSENKFLLQDVLKDAWGYEGVMVSDWGAVRHPGRSVAAGMDLVMPLEPHVPGALQAAANAGQITPQRLDDAVSRVLRFVLKERPDPQKDFDRDAQHRLARELAASCVVLMKNEHQALPLTKEKYKKIACFGGYATRPLISGQGSAEVNQSPDYTDCPLGELKMLLPEVEFTHTDIFHKDRLSGTMLWPYVDTGKTLADADAALFFIGAMEGEDTEQYDKNSAQLNPVYDYFIRQAMSYGKPVIVVLQTGSAVILGDWYKSVDAIAEMWLGGEAAGGGIADVLTGRVNPSGRLPETFPNRMRTDLIYRGDEKLVYNEKLDVGYRYYDKHPEEICFPFGHGLSYTSFAYADCNAQLSNDQIEVSFTLENTGTADGWETVQLYVQAPDSTVTRPIKELKSFQKIFLKQGEAKKVRLQLPVKDLSYYNIMLHDWVVEDGRYDLLVGASSQDIRVRAAIRYEGSMPYTMRAAGKTMVG